MACEIRITQSAQKDLDGIISYIAEELCNPQAAAHLLDEVAKVYRTLAENPLLYPACTQALLSRYRKLTVMRYVILYRVDEDAVYIERVFSRLEDYVHHL